MTVGSQMSELDRVEAFAPSPYKVGSKNTPYKLGLNFIWKLKRFCATCIELIF